MTSALRIGSNLLSVVLLVAVNLVPLIGVAFWGWSLMLILVLYWVAPGFGSGPMDFGPLPLDGLALSALLLAASHVVSFFTNYLGRGEYRRATPAGQMMSVYGRVVVLHITIIGGAFVIAAFGTPVAALVLLVGLKTLLDLVLHLRSHRVAAT